MVDENVLQDKFTVVEKEEAAPSAVRLVAVLNMSGLEPRLDLVCVDATQGIGLLQVLPQGLEICAQHALEAL